LKMCTDDNRIMMNNQFRYWLSQQPQVPSVWKWDVDPVWLIDQWI
jgi:hypothetical protein